MFNQKNPMSRNHRHGINTDLAEVSRMLKSLIDPYRPELHYMRGPGPKWHAKHRSSASDAPSLPGLARFKG